ncbi:MAG: quinol:cytochrome C oxidoreductase, partial [Bacteroidetes bacterium HGW-Bacteroidetes-17]
MDKELTISSKFKNAAYALIGIGIIAFIYGFIKYPERAWANLLINNYYFLALTIGATFFMALQYITQSGWSSGFVRIPQAIANFFPVLLLLMIPLLFGLHHLYHWSHAEEVAQDAILQHKAPYLNVPFFIIRFFIYFAVWIGLTQLLRKFSHNEDLEGGLKYFEKSEFYSKVYIFSLALTFSLATFDWVMSIDAHWFSTIFAIRNFAMSFYHAVVLITIIIILLNKLGYFPFFNKYHLQDLTKYIFILSIIWAYTWFSQYILIWYANIPEETVYYV